MALQKDTVSINLAKGVDSKVDDKIAGTEQTSVLKDARFDKDKRLVKRNGLTAQGVTLQGNPGFINPVAIQAGSQKSKTFAHEDQLCMVNDGSLFSQYQGQNKWIFKGTCVPCALTTKKLDPTIQFTDIGTTSGMTAIIGGQNVWILEEATGNVIAKTALVGTEQSLRILNFASTLYILTTDTATTNLYARPVTLSTGALGATVTICADYGGGATIPPDITITTGSTINEAAFILYSASVGSVSKIIPFLSTGAVSALGKQTTGVGFQSTYAILIEPTVNPNKVYVASLSGVEAYTFTSSAYTLVYTTPYTPSNVDANGFYKNISIALSPINNTDLYLFVDSSTLLEAGTNSEYEAGFSDDAGVALVTLNASGTVTYNAIYGYGYYISGKSIRDVTRKTIYLPCVYYSALQTTELLMDMLEGKSGKTTYVIGKCLYGLAARPTSGYLPQSALVSGQSYRSMNNGYVVTANLSPSLAQSSQYYAKTTHLTGGLLWGYDGDTVSEHNFLIDPEHLQAFPGQVAMTVTVDSVGAPGVNEQFHVTFNPAVANKRVSNNYFQFNTTTTGYYVWYTVDGIGTNPALGGRTGLQVTLLGTDSANDVALKTQLVLSAGTTGNIHAISSPANVISIRNSSSGAVTAPAVGGNGLAGALSAGSYQICHVYKWTDRNSQIYRSAPSVPVTFTAAASDAGYYTFWAPPITNKNVSSVSVEVYRTRANGSEFQLASTLSMPSTQSKVALYDTVSDATLGSALILYTNGGILENSNIGACSAIASFKERLVVNLSDDPFAVYYSKSLVSGEPINFTQDTFFRVDADKDGVSALAQMDDKLCVFKPKLIYVMSGDGADDLGNNSSFSPPMDMASDVGSSYPNSIVTFPNGLLFKSNKGIYSLNRSLGVQYTGAAVEAYNSSTVSGAVLMDSLNEIRFTLSDNSLGLIYNYLFDRWDYFTNYQADSACLWQNKMTLATNAGVVYVEGTNFYDINLAGTHVPYGIYAETVWLKLKGVQDFQRIYEAAFLGEYLSPHTLTVNLSYDYDPTVANSQDYVFDATTVIGGGGTGRDDQTYQFNISPAVQKCQAIKFKITETPGTGSQQSLVLNDLSLQVGLKVGLNKMKASKGV